MPRLLTRGKHEIINVVILSHNVCGNLLGVVLWIELCPPQNLNVEALAPSLSSLYPVRTQQEGG